MLVLLPREHNAFVTAFLKKNLLLNLFQNDELKWQEPGHRFLSQNNNDSLSFNPARFKVYIGGF